MNLQFNNTQTDIERSLDAALDPSQHGETYGTYLI